MGPGGHRFYRRDTFVLWDRICIGGSLCFFHCLQIQATGGLYRPAYAGGAFGYAWLFTASPIAYRAGGIVPCQYGAYTCLRAYYCYTGYYTGGACFCPEP